MGYGRFKQKISAAAVSLKFPFLGSRAALPTSFACQYVRFATFVIECVAEKDDSPKFCFVQDKVRIGDPCFCSGSEVVTGLFGFRVGAADPPCF
jgi:hypothetical protein